MSDWVGMGRELFFENEKWNEFNFHRSVLRNIFLSSNNNMHLSCTVAVYSVLNS